MKKVFLFKVLISFLLLSAPAYAKSTYISLAPSITEMIYALGAQDNLIGVSSKCSYPNAVKNKTKVGSLYGINREKILKLKPDYIFALSASKPFVSNLDKRTKIVYFNFNSFDDILNAITNLGDLFGKKETAKKVVSDIKNSFKPSKANKKIFYVIQTKPLITIGQRSYLKDVIKLSGNVCVTQKLFGEYTSVSLEYAIKLKPDYVVIGPYANINDLKPFFKHSKFLVLNEEQNDIINRPSPRIGEAINFFATLK